MRSKKKIRKVKRWQKKRKKLKKKERKKKTVTISIMRTTFLSDGGVPARTLPPDRILGTFIKDSAALTMQYQKLFWYLDLCNNSFTMGKPCFSGVSAWFWRISAFGVFWKDFHEMRINSIWSSRPMSRGSTEAESKTNGFMSNTWFSTCLLVQSFDHFLRPLLIHVRTSWR